MTHPAAEHPTRILVVEDEPAVREMIAYAVTCQGMRALLAANAREVEARLGEAPDLVLLDWMLEGASGLEIARRLRDDAATAAVPIIMVTARGDESDRLAAFEVGVDDYVVKPFSPRELAARIRALLRRTHGDDGLDALEHGALRIDAAAHRVYAHGGLVAIGPAEYRLLSFFLANPERAWSRRQVLDRVWGADDAVEERTVDVHIRRLRRTLAPHGVEFMVQTVRGMGYRFSSEPERV